MPLTKPAAPPPPNTVAPVRSKVPTKDAEVVPNFRVDAVPTPSVISFSTAPNAALSVVLIRP